MSTPGGVYPASYGAYYGTGALLAGGTGTLTPPGMILAPARLTAGPGLITGMWVLDTGGVLTAGTGLLTASGVVYPPPSASLTAGAGIITASLTVYGTTVLTGGTGLLGPGAAAGAAVLTGGAGSLTAVTSMPLARLPGGTGQLTAVLSLTAGAALTAGPGTITAAARVTAGPAAAAVTGGPGLLTTTPAVRVPGPASLPGGTGTLTAAPAVSPPGLFTAVPGLARPGYAQPAASAPLPPQPPRPGITLLAGGTGILEAGQQSLLLVYGTVTLPGGQGTLVTIPLIPGGGKYPAFGGDTAIPYLTLSAAVGVSYVAADRGYNPPSAGVPSSWPGPGAGTLPAGVTMPVISIRPGSPASVANGDYDTALAAWFGQVSTRNGQGNTVTPLITLWHEGERAGFGYTAAAVTGMHARAYKIFKANAPPGALYGQIFSTYSSTNGRITPVTGPSFVATQANGQPLDFYGLDLYPLKQSAGWTENPAAQLGNCYTQITSITGTGAVVAICECNTWAAQPGTVRAAWLAGAWTWLTSRNGLVFCVFFDAQQGIPWIPSDTTVIDELRVINDQSRSVRTGTAGVVQLASGPGTLTARSRHVPGTIQGTVTLLAGILY